MSNQLHSYTFKNDRGSFRYTIKDETWNQAALKLLNLFLNKQLDENPQMFLENELKDHVVAYDNCYKNCLCHRFQDVDKTNVGTALWEVFYLK